MKAIISVIAAVWLTGISFSQSKLEGVVWEGENVLPYAKVVLKNGNLRTLTGDDGSFVFENFPVGDTVIVITMMGLKDKEVKVSLVKNQHLRLEKIDMLSVDFDEVVVVGKMKESEAKANDIRLKSKQISDVLHVASADTPDKNISENLSRMPGISLERDQGEGRYISVRGTPQDWSSSLVNGDRLPVADQESMSRTIAFDAIPSELVEYVQVSKALLPDMEGDAVGGSVNFITRIAPDEQTLKVNLASGYNAQAQLPLYNGSIFYGNRFFKNKLGVLVNGTMYYRNWATDNYEVVYGSNYNHGLNRLELRDYKGVRETKGLNFALDWTFNNQSKIYVKGIYGNFKDDERNYKTQYNWAIGAGQTLRLQHIHSIAQTRLFGGEIGGEFNLSKRLKLDLKLASYDNKFSYGNVPYANNDDRNGYYVVQFERFNMHYEDQVFVDANGNRVSQGPDAFRLKLLDIDNPYGNGDKFDNIQPVYQDDVSMGQFEFSGAYSELNNTYERDPVVASADLSFEHSPRLNFKTGAKIRMKEGGKELSLHEWRQDITVTSLPVTLEQFSTASLNTNGGFLQELGSPYEDKILPFLTNGAVDNFLGLMGDSVMDRYMNSDHPHYEDWVGSRYTYTENVAAAYMMADFKINENLMLIGGLRTEYTNMTIKGDTILEGYFDFTTLKYVYPVEEVSQTTNNLSLLPMLHLKWSPKKMMNFRVAATRTFRRPNFIEAKPGAAMQDLSNLEYKLGNRNLKPTYSWNLDLMVEKFFLGGDMLSFGAFYKYIEDHIFATVTADQDPQTGILYKSYQNAKTPSHVAGVEFNASKSLSFIHKKLKNFGINGNASFVYSEMKVPGRTEKQRLPRQSAAIGNFAAYYENPDNGLTARLSLNYKSKYLIEINGAAVASNNSTEPTMLLHQDTDYDVFMNGRMTLDFYMTYQVSHKVSVYLELGNLTNAPMYIYRGDVRRPIQREWYSTRAQLGVKIDVFAKKKLEIAD